MKISKKQGLTGPALKLLPLIGIAASLLTVLAAAFIVLRFSGSAVSGFIGAAVFIPVLVFLILGLRMVIRRLLSLEELVKPLSEKKFSALTAAENSGISRENRYASLSESLSALKQFFAALEKYLSRNLGLENVLRDESGERDAIINHAEEVIARITKQFTEIETSVQQAMEALAGIEEYVLSLDAGSKKQSSVLEESGDRLSRSVELAVSAAGKIRESAQRAEALRTEIATGEEQAQEVNDIVKTIDREVEGIAEMIGIINKISEQTNILSMNAAIESAHAGQAGAGFAVVADEIRKLADSTRENAGRINEELSAIRAKTREALKASESSFGTFSAVTGKIADLASTLGGISEEALEGSAINGEIRALMQENAGIRPDSAVDIMVHHQSFKSSLELINGLSDKTRAEIKELHSGTREIIEKIKKTEELFLKNLKETGDFKNLFLSEDLPKKPAPQAVLPPPLSTPALPGPEAQKTPASAPPAPKSVPLNVPPEKAPLSKPAETPAPALQPASPAAPQPQSAEHKTLVIKTGGISAAARDISEKEQYSDSREVAVKKPPSIIP
jgi:methyl-accepting chemotaxis protein